VSRARSAIAPRDPIDVVAIHQKSPAEAILLAASFVALLSAAPLGAEFFRYLLFAPEHIVCTRPDEVPECVERLEALDH
jgi:hypothetical protein